MSPRFLYRRGLWTSMVPEVVNLAWKFALFSDAWNPKIVGELNDAHVKLVKLRGEFVWHKHDTEDELFLVVRGTLRIRFRDGDTTVHEGELVIVPRGVDHLPVADAEVHAVLIEPKTTLNTGDRQDARTIVEPERI